VVETSLSISRLFTFGIAAVVLAGAVFAVIYWALSRGGQDDGSSG
jgi:hypothetical protein